MIYEVAELYVAPVDREAYMQRYAQAWRTACFAGSYELTLLKCIEDARQVVSLIQWDSVEAHLSQSASANKVPFRATIHSGLNRAIVLHYEYEQLSE